MSRADSTRPTSLAPAHEQALNHAQDEVADIFGNIAAFWGFTRTQGRIYGLLFLHPEPLSHGDIQRRLGISAGSTSMTLSSLVHWGVLRRRDRAYEPETDMWKVITGVFRRREKEQVDNAIDRIERVVDSLKAIDDLPTPSHSRWAVPISSKTSSASDADSSTRSSVAIPFMDFCPPSPSGRPAFGPF